MRWFYRAIGGGAWPVMRSHVSWCVKAMRVSVLSQKQYYVVWDDGKPKCEIMVALSVWEGATLWFDISLLITTTTGAVRLGCVPPVVLHCYLVLDTSTRLLYVPHVGERKYIIHESERRCSCTWHGLAFASSRDPSIQTRTKKGEGGSFPMWKAGGFGIVCSRQGGRKGNKQIKVERLSFGKIWFYGVRTH